MDVVKLGGSLTHSAELRLSLDRLERRARQRRIIIVPGGGPFADQVRTAQERWRFDDRAAHCMAILAMQQMAILLQALRPKWRIVSSVDEIADNFNQVDVQIWSPRISELDRAGVPADWDVTSDSLAAWLASRLEASDLLLVKAAALPGAASVERLQALGIIDPAFHQFTGQATFNIHIVNPQQL